MTDTTAIIIAVGANTIVLIACVGCISVVLGQSLDRIEAELKRIKKKLEEK